MPADSKMDPPLGKVEAMRDCGSASGITDLRRGLFNTFKRRVRCVKEATLWTTKSVKKKGEEMHQSRHPLHPMVVHVNQIFNCSPWRALHWKR